jgi:hypothetical protein
MKSRIRGFSSHCIFALTSSSTKYLTARRSEKIMKFAFFGRAARKSVGRLGSLSLAKVWSTLLNYFSILGETSWPSVSEGKCVVIMTPRRLRLTTLEVLAQKKVFRCTLRQLRLVPSLELLEHSGSVFPAICLRNSWRGPEIVVGGPWLPYNPDLLSRVVGTLPKGLVDATCRNFRAGRHVGEC